MSETETDNASKWTGAKGIVAILTGATVLAGCLVMLLLAFRGESEEDAEADFCDSLTDFSATVEKYEDLDLQTATDDELENAYHDVEGAWDDVLDHGDDWVKTDDNGLTSAYWDLNYAVQDLRGENTWSENIDALEPQLTAIPAAFEETFDGSGCAAS